MRAMRNYAGHRLAPWLGHLMVSRSETARALLTPGEVMQLPPEEEIVMVAGTPPVRARKARYFEDARFCERLLPVPELETGGEARPDDWTGRVVPTSDGRGLGTDPASVSASTDIPRSGTKPSGDPENAGLRREPGFEPRKENAAEPPVPPKNEFDPDIDGPGQNQLHNKVLKRDMGRIARQISMNPDDGMEL